MRRALVVSALLSVLGASPVLAVEGMWQPAQLAELSATLKAKGFQLDPASLGDLDSYPMGAVVSLGGCSASFVSPKGLIVTNHHCAYGALQYNSTAEDNLIVDGFLAKSLAEELPGSPGMRVYVTEQITDVTDKVNAGIKPWMTGGERYDAIERAEKSLVAGCETEGYRCSVRTFYGGISYQLIKQMEIQDVRLVYAPPESIGKFGGDVDNWMWPRHTGDFSFLRAYVAPNGHSAPYSKDNVPYQPDQVLKVNPEGLEAGDFVMVVGYPGYTNRYSLAMQVENAVSWRYPKSIQRREDMIAIIDAAAAKDPAAGVAYASTKASLNNYLKNFRGQMEGINRSNTIAAKKALEAELAAWLKEQGGAENLALLADIDKLRDLTAEGMEHRQRDFALGLVGNTDVLSSAVELVHMAKARAKPDAERDPWYQERNWSRHKAGLERMQRRFVPAVDQQFLVYALERYVKLPESERLSSLDNWLDGAASHEELVERVAELFAETKLTQTEDRLHWFASDLAAIQASDDSMLQLALALQPQLQALDDQEEARYGEWSKLKPRQMQAMIAWKASRGQPVYPDANGTLRVTFGTVQGYSPADAVWYEPFTTARGVVEKHTGQVPFNVPEAELEAIKAGDFDGYASEKIGGLPVDFLADLDITGGNSGSPAMDAKGRLVGLAFDGNWESISGSWLFNPKLNRSIQVDVRYMLWVMHHLDHADNLIREMGLEVPSSESSDSD